MNLSSKGLNSSNATKGFKPHRLKLQIFAFKARGIYLSSKGICSNQICKKQICKGSFAKGLNLKSNSKLADKF
ncbi:hypothetical protein [Campylobacter troglodytis]|uniref:hypothetical protein n=1 Tax=Campylobacter troglodytis TaxID=654363 RepID=UPI0011596DB3|nr:hypothetical protein [Campylobacter troglodytis]TQR52290.1 hypothetical protein DMC01_12525 [Campylobacter troglodytis]